jgi:hypothetical protein
MSRRVPRSKSRRAVVAAAVVGVSVLAASTLPSALAVAGPAPSRDPLARHVLLVSIDGMHQSDLRWYVDHHPRSALAALVLGGSTYSNAKTTFPSDSFPGMIAQLTGANSGTAGIYYDDTYNHRLLAPGTVDCATATAGTEVAWTESADLSQNPITVDAGQHLLASALTQLPTNTLAQTLANHKAITAAALRMTGTPQSLLNPAALPLSPTTCLPLYPHQVLKVNTVFEVVRSHGLRTAWSDKHPAYEILNGPSGSGVQDLFTPEINGVADSAGDDWTTDNSLTKEYDGIKVAAVLNEINGWDHSGTRRVGTPAIFGMNFQSVSTAEKLAVSDGLMGGYLPDGSPGPLLSQALNFVDTQIGIMRSQINRDGLASSTTIIVSAKHGQSPRDVAALRRVNDGAIMDGLNAAWATNHSAAAPLVSFSVNDDVMLAWLSNRSSTALEFTKTYLLTHTAPANVAGDPKGIYSTVVNSSGLRQIFLGFAADALLGAPRGDSGAPDLIGLVQHGVVYTSGVKKIAEHGGDDPQDRQVPLIVFGAGVRHRTTDRQVTTAQIAPSILTLLGLNPQALDAVRLDNTRVLPGL